MSIKRSACFLLLALMPFSFVGKVAAAPEPMNVLFLIVDDLNTWLLEDPDRYTGTVVAPNIKALADSGMRFNRAFTASPKCSPSRTAFLSGVAPWKSGIYENSQDAENSPALQGIPDIVQHFHDNGYYTSGGGKIAHGYDLGDVWDNYIVGHTTRDEPYPLLADGTPLKGWGKVGVEKDYGIIDAPDNIGPILEEDMMDTMSANFAIETISNYTNSAQPFFIACGLFHPHFPWHAPQRFFDMYPLESLVIPEVNDNDQDDIPAIGLSYIRSGLDADIKANNQVKDAVRGYLACTSYSDHQIGRVLDALDASPYATNTIVVLLTDHGFHLGEKQHWDKSTLWEEAMNSVLMFRAPGVTETNQTCSRVVSLLDVYPTLVELAGLPAPDHLDGRSLVPLLENPASSWDYPVVSAFNMELAVRSEDYRYIRYTDGSEELYDRTVDPHEWTNLASVASYDAIKADLNALLPASYEMAPPMYEANKYGPPMMLTVDLDIVPDGSGDQLLLSPISIDGKGLVDIPAGSTSVTFAAAYEPNRVVTVAPLDYEAIWQGDVNAVEGSKAFVDMGKADRSLSGNLSFEVVLPPAVTPSDCLAHYDASISSSITTNALGVVTGWTDQSGNNYHAVPGEGDVYFPSTSLSASGLAGINFTNESRSLELFSLAESEAWLDFTGAASSNSGFAVLVALKIDTLNATTHDIIGNSSSTRNGFAFRVEANGSKFKTWLGSAYFTTSGGTVANGDTVVLAANYNAATGMYAFWNSVDNASISDTVSATNFVWENPITLGRTTSSSRYLDGMVGEVKVYNRAFDATEFQAAHDEMVDKWITDASGYYGWVAAHGVANGRDGDDDGDGDSNIGEFYFGGNPTNAAIGSYWPKLVPGDGTNSVRLTYRRRADLPEGSAYRIQATDSLIDPLWLELPTVVLGQDVLPEDASYWEMIHSIPVNKSNEFIRLIIE